MNKIFNSIRKNAVNAANWYAKHCVTGVMTKW